LAVDCGTIRGIVAETQGVYTQGVRMGTIGDATVVHHAGVPSPPAAAAGAGVGVSRSVPPGWTRKTVELQRGPLPGMGLPPDGLAGVGFSFETTGTGMHLLSTLAPNGSAATSGRMQPGDVLISVDAVQVQGLSAGEVIRLVKGLPGSTVVLLLHSSLPDVTPPVVMAPPSPQHQAASLNVPPPMPPMPQMPAAAATVRPEGGVAVVQAPTLTASLPYPHQPIQIVKAPISMELPGVQEASIATLSQQPSVASAAHLVPPQPWAGAAMQQPTQPPPMPSHNAPPPHNAPPMQVICVMGRVIVNTLPTYDTGMHT